MRSMPSPSIACPSSGSLPETSRFGTRPFWLRRVVACSGGVGEGVIRLVVDVDLVGNVSLLQAFFEFLDTWDRDAPTQLAELPEDGRYFEPQKRALQKNLMIRNARMQ